MRSNRGCADVAGEEEAMGGRARWRLVGALVVAAFAVYAVGARTWIALGPAVALAVGRGIARALGGPNAPYFQPPERPARKGDGNDSWNWPDE
jgi:hypothetical protein